MIVLSLIVLVSAVGFIEPTNVLTIDDLADEMQANELPKIYLDGDIADLKTKGEERKVSVKYTTYNKEIDAYARIKLQGSSSIAYDKKNYTIYFYEDEDLDHKLKIDVGWGEQYKYCLKANWVDKTHARNIVSARLVGTIQEKYDLFTDAPNNGAVDGFPIEVYLNGEFLGLYTMNIPKDEWMFNVDPDENDDFFFVSAAAPNAQTTFYKEATYDSWDVEAGNKTTKNLNRLNRLVSFIKDSSDAEFRENINEYFNLDALLNYYVIIEYGEFYDNVSKNLLLITYDGKIWYPCLYDLDSTWGTYYNGKSTIDYTNKLAESGSLLWKRVAKCFPNELAERYFELRKEYLNEDYVLEQFNSYIKSIPQSSYEKERERWGENIPGYDISQIEDFLKQRTPVIDKWFYDMYTEETVVTVVYQKNKDGTITAKIKSNHEDIIVLGESSYTFTKDGSYTFFYTNFFGDRDFITAEVSGIKYNF